MRPEVAWPWFPPPISRRAGPTGVIIRAHALSPDSPGRSVTPRLLVASCLVPFRPGFSRDPIPARRVARLAVFPGLWRYLSRRADRGSPWAFPGRDVAGRLASARPAGGFGGDGRKMPQDP